MLVAAVLYLYSFFNPPINLHHHHRPTSLTSASSDPDSRVTNPTPPWHFPSSHDSTCSPKSNSIFISSTAPFSILSFALSSMGWLYSSICSIAIAFILIFSHIHLVADFISYLFTWRSFSLLCRFSFIFFIKVTGG